MDRLHSSVLSFTASSLDTWLTCRHRYLLRYVLDVEPSDDGRDMSSARRVHDMLQQIHDTGSCNDGEHVDHVLSSYGLADDPEMRGFVERHRIRCPPRVEREWHEREVARHWRPSPSFIVTGRLDAIWIHDGLLDVRDYKTGRSQLDRVADDDRAQLQAWVVAPRAAALGLQLRIRYEFLAPEVDDDPEPFEPDDEDLDAVHQRLVGAARELRAEQSWPGTPVATICQTCEFRSICTESLAPGIRRWEHAAATD